MDHNNRHQQFCLYLLSLTTGIFRNTIPLKSFSPIPQDCLDPFVSCLFVYKRKLINKHASSVNNAIIDLTTSGTSFMYNKKNKGPSTVPWGTPDKIVTHSIKKFLIL